MTVRGVMATVVGVFGMACIVAGIVVLMTPDETSPGWESLATLVRVSTAVPLFLVGTGCLLGAVLAHKVPGPAKDEDDASGSRAPTAPVLPEARVHGRPRSKKGT